MFVTQVQMQYNKNPESLLTCSKLLLQNTTTSANPTLCLHMKDVPLHRRKFYARNLNGRDLQKKLHNLPRNIILFYFLIYFTLLLLILTLIPVVYFIHI
jgi:magnesium-transporting ATPase (P-type)